MAKDRATPSPEDQAIGQRTRRVRKRRDLSLDVVAGSAGISKSYLSQLETGKKGFTRRGLIEDLARALGCSAADLTGQPYPPRDRESIDVADTVSEIGKALYDTTLDMFDGGGHWRRTRCAGPVCRAAAMQRPSSPGDRGQVDK